MDTIANGCPGIGMPVSASKIPTRSTFLLSLILTLVFMVSCSKEDNLSLQQSEENASVSNLANNIIAHYEQTNLVADVSAYNPTFIDPNLVNAWGIAISPNGAFWISAEGTQLSTIYDDEGVTLRPPVTMVGGPTGQVFNPTTGFVIPNVGPARFIFVTEEGTITAWRTGNVAPTMVNDLRGGSSYTGCEIARHGTQDLLYVANVAKGSIDVYDQNWAKVPGYGFVDPTLPAGARPFNIQLMFDKLYVTYVVAGYGLVNVFTTGGDFIKRFAMSRVLQAPWGITNTPPEFGLGDAILVGNFGDGRINVYAKNGQFQGQLGDEDGNPITIDGLWALEFTPAALAGNAEADLYFTAGPDNETHGIYGEIEFGGEEEK